MPWPTRLQLRAAYNDNLPKVTEFHTRLGADERLYAKYKAIAASAAAADLSAPRRKALANALRDFVLVRRRARAARRRCALRRSRSARPNSNSSTREHVLDATDGFSYLARADELDGVPADVQQAARAAAQADGVEGYKLTLALPELRPGDAVRRATATCASGSTPPTSHAPANSARSSATTAG